MFLLAVRGNGRRGCRRSRPGSSWPANHAREAAVRWVRAIVCALAATFAATAMPARAETIVRWASSAGMSTWEPLANDSWSKSGLHQVYEGLVLNGADLTLHP